MEQGRESQLEEAFNRAKQGTASENDYVLLVLALQSVIWPVIFRTCPPNCSPEDIQQDVLSKLLGKNAAVRLFQGEWRGFQAFAYTVSLNRCLDEKRTWQRRQTKMPTLEWNADEVDVIGNVPGCDPDPAATHISNESVKEIEKAIMSLPEDQRNVMFMTIGGISSAEIALAISTVTAPRTINAVDILRFKAREKLKTILGRKE